MTRPALARPPRWLLAHRRVSPAPSAPLLAHRYVWNVCVCARAQDEEMTFEQMLQQMKLEQGAGGQGPLV